MKCFNEDSVRTPLDYGHYFKHVWPSSDEILRCLWLFRGTFCHPSCPTVRIIIVVDTRWRQAIRLLLLQSDTLHGNPSWKLNQIKIAVVTLNIPLEKRLKWRCFLFSEDSSLLIGCGFPGAPAHSTVEFSTTVVGPGTVARYSCDRGFELLGPARRICNTNGTWVPQGIPFCGKIPFRNYTIHHMVMWRRQQKSLESTFSYSRKRKTPTFTIQVFDSSSMGSMPCYLAGWKQQKWSRRWYDDDPEGNIGFIGFHLHPG